MMAAAVLAVLGSAAASTVASAHPLHALMRATVAAWILAGLLLLVYTVPVLVRFKTLLASGLILAIGLDSAWQTLHGTDVLGIPMQGSRAPAFLPHANDMALVPVLLPLAGPWMWPVAALAVLVSHSRNALVGLVVVSLLLLPRGWRRPAALTTTLAVLLAWWIRGPVLGDLDISSRLGLWWVAWQMFLSAPVLGMGPHAFVDAYLPMVRAGGFPFGLSPEVAFVPWAHSLYLEVLGERGLLGLVAWALPVVFVFRSGASRVRLSMTGLLVMGVMDLTLLKPWVFGAYWALVALASVPETEVQECRSRSGWWGACCSS